MASNARDDPAAVATSFLREYDRWAQDGFAAANMEDVSSLASPGMVDGLKSDSYWYSRGEVRQVGSMAYSGLTVTRKDVDSATVVVKVDASGVTLTAEGDEIEFDQGQANQLELFLIMDDKSSMWLVDQVQATRQ